MEVHDELFNEKDVSGDSKMLFCFKVSCESQEQDVAIVKPLENHSKLIDFQKAQYLTAQLKVSNKNTLQNENSIMSCF